MKKRIVLCADDYGQAPAISQGILALLKAGRLSAVSCLVTSPHWPEHASLLRHQSFDADIGLHFDLTTQTPLSRIMLAASIRMLSKAKMVLAWQRQIDAFAEHMGHLPHFIDGHQHVHQFPIVRDAMLRVYLERLNEARPYVRHVSFKQSSGHLAGNLKQIIVQKMGSTALLAMLERHQIPHNSTFSGMYAFNHSSKYSDLFLNFLKQSDDQGLIMCHPGLISTEVSDPIALARFHEYQYLSDHSFINDCTLHGVQIGRFNKAKPV